MARTANASTVNKLGYYIPVALFAAVLLSIGSGLIATFSPGTSTGKWIGYQILYGAGRGLGLQMVCLKFPNTDTSANLVTLFSLAANHRCSKCSATPTATHGYGTHHFQPIVWGSGLPQSRGNHIQQQFRKSHLRIRTFYQWSKYH